MQTDMTAAITVQLLPCSALKVLPFNSERLERSDPSLAAGPWQMLHCLCVPSSGAAH